MSHRPEPHHWFEAIADHLGPAYLKYSFTKGTSQEVDFLDAALGLAPGARILDVGCGPGRHALALADCGYEVVGVDISRRFVDLAAAATGSRSARFERVDARRMDYEAEFDAVISLCQGGFGIVGGPDADRCSLDPDGEVLTRMAAAVKPGGPVVFSAFSAYFQIRFLEDTDTFDAETGVNHERTTIMDSDRLEVDVDLWTSCFTPRELRLLADRAGLSVEAIHGVWPGRYGHDEPTLDVPEFLVLCRR